MTYQAVYCIVGNRAKAEQIIQHLVNAGISHNDISFLSSQNKDFSEFTPGHVATERNWRTENRLTGAELDAAHTPRNVAPRGEAMGTEKHTKAPEGATTGATAGGIIGGALGLLAGIGALAIPGIGPFIAAGPIMAALGGLGAGGLTGGIIGALVGAGIPEYEAKRYEGGLKKGGILFAVRVKNDAAAKQAQDIMKKDGAEDISVSSEAAAKQDFRK